MKLNVGKPDRIIRIILGLAIGILGIINHNWWGIIGLVLILTAVFGFCPIYWITRLSTYKKANGNK